MKNLQLKDLICATRIDTKRISLRAVTRDDRDAVFEIYSDKHVCEHFDLLPFKDPTQADEHIARWLSFLDRGTQFRLVVEYSHTVIGTVGCHGIRPTHRRALIGYDLKPAFWGRGFMYEALVALLPFLREQMNLNRIGAEVLSENTASKRLLGKIGFKYEGMLRQYETWPGHGLVDLESHSLLLDEQPTQNKSNCA